MSQILFGLAVYLVYLAHFTDFSSNWYIVNGDIIVPQVQALPLMLLVYIGDGRLELAVTRHPLFRSVITFSFFGKWNQKHISLLENLFE